MISIRPNFFLSPRHFKLFSLSHASGDSTPQPWRPGPIPQAQEDREQAVLILFERRLLHSYGAKSRGGKSSWRSCAELGASSYAGSFQPRHCVAGATQYPSVWFASRWRLSHKSKGARSSDVLQYVLPLSASMLTNSQFHSTGRVCPTGEYSVWSPRRSPGHHQAGL